jgi:NAD(P)-dependent dehydrogenase (short-subunit alcohol dehydrogenase family)
MAVALADAGADVSVCTRTGARDEEIQANSILNECWSFGRRGEARSVDLVDADAVEEAVGDIERVVGPIDILVNGAHEATIGPFLEAASTDLMSDLSQNVLSAMHATRSVGRRMVERGRGRIIMLVSVLHDRGAPNCSLFGASQGAVLGFSRSLGIEWGRRGVTVNALGLGFYEDAAGPQRDPEVVSVLERYIPMRRLGAADDLQGALLYLASDEAAFMQSELIVVDGAIALHA